MGKKLFLVTDPSELEKYSQKKLLRRRGYNLEVIRRLDLLKRALQELPPRELYMLYAVKVLNAEQNEITDLFSVRQSNISYRLERARYRIQLYYKLAEICSETTLRKVLYDIGLTELAVRTVLGISKTSSQSATAAALGITQSAARLMFVQTLAKLQKEENKNIPNIDKALKYLLLIRDNQNQKRSIKYQQRFANKVQFFGNYPTPRRNSLE